MTQSFIYLGEGYSDFFELHELIHYNKQRISHIAALHTSLEKDAKTTIIIIMQPTRQGHFQGIYTILEGLPYPYHRPNKRFDFIQAWCGEAGIPLKEFDVKARRHFHEDGLYENYLIGVLRLQRLLPPLG